MEKVPAGDTPPRDLATLDEVRSASKALTDQQKKAIRIYAEARARGRQRHCPGITGKELMNEAAKRALLGKRKWPLREVTFDKFMMGIIRSIASDLARTSAGKLSQLSSSDEAALDEASLNEVPGPEEQLLNAEQDAEQERLFEALQAEFADDPITTSILTGILDNERPRETMERLDLPANKYNAARRKILRHLAKLCLPN
jgi:hypothetical protein